MGQGAAALALFWHCLVMCEVRRMKHGGPAPETTQRGAFAPVRDGKGLGHE